MYVDEREGHRTFVVWIPLQDVDHANGPLQVLPRSHRLEHRLRGTHLNAPWIQHEDVIRPRLQEVPVPLGHAAIVDNGLVHASLPNHTDEPRLVAAIGLKPRTAPLVHFLSSGDDRAVRYDVDADFFLEQTPQALMASPPHLEVREHLAAEQLVLGPDDLAHRLALDDPPAPSPPAAAAPPAAPPPGPAPSSPSSSPAHVFRRLAGRVATRLGALREVAGSRR
jgi:hypothetical protein